MIASPTFAKVHKKPIRTRGLGLSYLPANGIKLADSAIPWLEVGDGVPTHDRPDGSQYVNASTGIAYLRSSSAWVAVAAAGQTWDAGAAGIKADVVAESTAATGVTVDGVLLKDGAVTSTALPITTAEIGAKNGATVTATENGDGVWHKTTLTCVATPMTFGDEGGQGQYGGTKVYDFPEGLILFAGAVVDGDMTLAAPAIDAWEGDVGLGTAAPTDHQTGINAAGVSLLDATDVAAATSKVAAIPAVSVATALTESGGRWVDGTGTPADLYLNLLIDDNGAHDNTITGTFTGTITFLWALIGDL